MGERPLMLQPLRIAGLRLRNRMVEQYARGAERALRAGFDAINIQGAHGWPLARSRINDPAVALHMVEEGAVDLLGIGRQLLADPDFPLKTARHRWDAINRCIGCDVCLAQTMLRGRTLSCPINPTLGREVEQRPPTPRARVPRRVHVVGAGIAGLEVAWGLARRGHQVTPWEQAPAPGGLLRQVAGMPAVHLRDLASYGEYVLRALISVRRASICR